ncbi:hypothetical protein [Sciscionella marina]|uniref:hypothetical protein n=1 Tax=Sciscionella marina TaxID=508770 RepID=UPI000369150A|nr:hypothetical protein [Sciscionella marina]
MTTQYPPADDPCERLAEHLNEFYEREYYTYDDVHEGAVAVMGELSGDRSRLADELVRANRQRRVFWDLLETQTRHRSTYAALARAHRRALARATDELTALRHERSALRHERDHLAEEAARLQRLLDTAVGEPLFADS